MSDEQTLVSVTPRWFHLRLRTLLIASLAFGGIVAIYGSRQVSQRRALVGLQKLNAIVRTEPVAVPGVRELVGEQYSQQIIEVYLRHAEISDEDLAIVGGATTLRKLELTGSTVTGAGLQHLQGLRNLYVLHLSETSVDDAGLVYLRGHPSLGILSLDRTCIGDAGLEHIASLPQLERLFLDETQITDRGLVSLGRLLNLKQLNLNRVAGVTDAGIQHLEALTQLEILKLNGTSVSKAAVERLRSSLPKCRISISNLVEEG